MENYRKERQKKVHTHQRIFSRVLAKNYLRDLGSNTVSYVEGQGFFRDEIDKQLVEQFLPGLYVNSLQEQAEINKWKQQAQCKCDKYQRNAGSCPIGCCQVT